jgi:hypothetical protein
MFALNYVSGYKEAVGFTNLSCRCCMMKKDELENIHHERDCTLRNKDSHENYVLEIENPEQTKAFRESLSTKYGINNRCPLSSLVYFDPTKCFMQDLMHVFHAGVLNTSCALSVFC